MSRGASAAALLAAVFFAGAATTLAVLRVAEQRADSGSAPAAFRRGESPPDFAVRSLGRRGAPPFAKLARTRVTEDMTRRLGLTDEQRRRIEDALDRRRAASEEAMRRVLPILRGQRDSLNAEIEEILTDEQRAAFRKQTRGRSERRRP